VDPQAGSGRFGGFGKLQTGLVDAFAAFAAHQFELNVKQDDGCTLREHMMAYERAAGEVHDFMEDAPILPRGLIPLWVDFIDLHGSRGAGMAGPARITFGDILAWQTVTGAALDSWELSAIRKADDAFIAHCAKDAK